MVKLRSMWSSTAFCSSKYDMAYRILKCSVNEQILSNMAIIVIKMVILIFSKTNHKVKIILMNFCKNKTFLIKAKFSSIMDIYATTQLMRGVGASNVCKCPPISKSLIGKVAL